MKHAAKTDGRTGEVKKAFAIDSPKPKDTAVTRRELAERPTIEISDADYRSFCWPCTELEDSKGCKSGR